MDLNISKIPQTTGVYLFLDKNKSPIYIGKAVNIRERIKQHLTDRINPKEKAIAKNYRFLKWIETNSEFEALTLEANLIRQFKPKYNLELKDDKSPIYIVITKEKFPKVQLYRKNQLQRIEKYIFGPLESVKTARMLLRNIRKIIPYCSAKKITKKPCFYSQISLCNPCPNVIANTKNKEKQKLLLREYLRNIRQIILLLKGDGQRLLKELRKEMYLLAQKERFEEAASLRNKITFLEKLFQKRFILDDRLNDPNFIYFVREREERELKTVLGLQRVKRIECYDVSGLAFEDKTASMVVFERGLPIKSDYKRFKIKTQKKSDPEMLLEVLQRRLKHDSWELPDLIVIDGGTPQMLAIYPLLKKNYKNIPEIIGIAKKPDRILLGKTLKYLKLPSDSPALHYLQRVRDEAHRFARSYHLLLRRKRLLRSLKITA